MRKITKVLIGLICGVMLTSGTALADPAGWSVFRDALASGKYAAKFTLLNLVPRTAPASPANGDVWTTTTGIYARINGATVGPFASTAALSSYLPLAGGTLTGPLLFTDNTLDIGASGATRPRTGYFGTGVSAPNVYVTGLTAGYLPYAAATTKLLTNSPFFTNGSNTGHNQATFGTSAVNWFYFPTGTAPTSSPASAAGIGVQNYNGVANTARLHQRTETGVNGAIAMLSETDIYYGIAWDESADTYTRTGRLATQALNVSPPSGLLSIHSNMRRCVLTDAGSVAYYLSATDSTKKEDGVTASNLTGTDGQVMVEIPKFWYRHKYIGTIHYWEVSPTYYPGFAVHPAFIKDGVEVNNRYIGAYEGILYDVSGAAYTDGSSTQVKDFTATTGDKLSSVSGYLAVTNGTRANFRTIAANRGTGWRQLDYDLHSAVQLLYLVEYGNFNSQSMIGSGISNVTDWAVYNNYYPIATSGNSNSIGNATGNTAGASTCAVEASRYVSYRGIEQWFGHIWKRVDGVNVNSNQFYVTNTTSSFADDTASGYTSIGTAINADGWPSTLLNISRGFLPRAVGASSSTKITDYYYQASGWRVVVVGGSAGYGVIGGAFYLNASSGSGGATQDVGGRLTY